MGAQALSESPQWESCPVCSHVPSNPHVSMSLSVQRGSDVVALKVAKFGETLAMRCSVRMHLGQWDGAASSCHGNIASMPIFCRNGSYALLLHSFELL